MQSVPDTGAADAAPGPALHLQRLAPNSIRRPRVNALYLLSLWLVTIFCLLIPLIYVGLIAGIGWLEYLFYSEWRLDGWARYAAIKIPLLALILYAFPGVLGGTLLLFMLKPLFAPRGEPPASYPIDAAREAEFVAAVRALCKAMGIRPPTEIRLCNEVNAWVQFKGGLFGLFTGRKTLTIGLPFVAGLNARQFVSVLAHEFGHFAQGGGMRCSYLINTVNGWLYSRAYTEDAWDQKLKDATQDEEGGFLFRLMAWIILGCLGATRMLMRGLFQLSFRLSRRLSQEMEFDADRYGAIVAGSECARELSLLARGLSRAWMQTRMKNAAAWSEGRLVDDVPEAVRLRLQDFKRAEWEHVELELQGAHTTEYWHSHPADQERIESAERLGSPGLFTDTRPAAALFSDFGATSRRITMLYYKDANLPVGPNRMIDAQKLWGMNRVDEGLKDGWDRFTNGMLADVLPLRPDDPLAGATAEMPWQATIDELRRLGPEVQGLWTRLARRHQRADDLAFWLLLIEHGIDFRMADGDDYDGGAIRQEYLDCLSETDADAKLATRVLALFARRLRCAVDATEGDDGERAAVAYALLTRLSRSWSKVMGLATTRQSLMRLHAGAPPESDVIRQLVHRLAEHYRTQVNELLDTFDEIPYEDGGLGKHLRNRCGHWSSAGSDPLQFLRVTAPLANGFVHVYRTTLAELVDIAARTESAHGIAPIKIVIRPRAEAAA